MSEKISSVEAAKIELKNASDALNTYGRSVDIGDVESAVECLIRAVEALLPTPQEQEEA